LVYKLVSLVFSAECLTDSGRTAIRWNQMNSRYGSVLLLCISLLVVSAYCSEVEARQRGFFFAPFFAAWPGQYYRPAWRHRYYAQPRKRKALRSVRATQTRKRQQAALLISRTAPRTDKSIGCEKARDILTEYGFQDIKAEVCTGITLGFSASRDGKPFSIRILAANGELEEVRRQR
jgi:hypothetical protein